MILYCGFMVRKGKKYIFASNFRTARHMRFILFKCIQHSHAMLYYTVLKSNFVDFIGMNKICI